MGEWKFKHVSEEEFDEGLRRAHVPEFLIREMREKRASLEQVPSDVSSSVKSFKPSLTTQDFLNRK